MTVKVLEGTLMMGVNCPKHKKWMDFRKCQKCPHHEGHLNGSQKVTSGFEIRCNFEEEEKKEEPTS